MIGVYKITNTINNKCYIGQSINMQRRWKEHKWDTIKGKSTLMPIHMAMRKYGIDTFVFEVILECSRSLLDNVEMLFIARYNTVKEGYNVLVGGNCFAKGLTHLAHGKPKTQAHRDKIGAANLGKTRGNGILSNTFREWSYIDNLGNKFICTDITKRQWLINNKAGNDTIKASIRTGLPKKRGNFKGFQFFNDIDFGGGFAESILRPKPKHTA